MNSGSEFHTVLPAARAHAKFIYLKNIIINLTMTLNIYISYGLSNKTFVESLYSILRQSGYNVVTNWHEYYESNQDMFESVKTQISWSDVAIFFISINDMKRDHLIREITIARLLEKAIIPIVEPDAYIPIDIKNYPYIIFDKVHPEITLANIYKYADDLKQRKDRNSILGLVFLSGAVLLLASALSDEKSEAEE